MKKCLSTFLPAIFFCSCLALGATENIPVRVQRVNERVTIFTTGKYAPPASMTVLSTPKGLIVIDTLLSPTLAEQAMQQVKKELGRDDVLLVINTHDHLDHTGGNQVFKGKEIVGQENVVPAMKRSADVTAVNLPRIQFRIAQRQRQLQGLASQSTAALSLAEENEIDRQMLDDFQKRFVSTPPTRTFADKLVLEAGGLELRLYYFGRSHTDSAIVIHVPELGLLFTGDLFHTGSISVTAAPWPLDIPRWISVLGEVLKTGKGVRTVVGGHGLVYNREWLDAQHRYIRELWAAVTQAKKDAKSLESFSRSTPLEPAFSFLAAHFDLKAKQNLDRHQENIQAYWRVGLQPATAEIERVMSRSGPAAARIRFQELLATGEREFFIVETEFNALGYRFLQQENKTAEAVALFEMNTDAFPGSWNAWDSLGEALLAQGEFDKAEDCYKKSLELNPGSQSGKDALARIRLDYRGETKETEKFAPGQTTKLKGPYLGQTPPGLEPAVFAPGIVSTAGHFEFSIAFSPDGKEIYFTRRRDPGGLNTMMACRREKDGWTAPAEAAFCKGYPSNEPHITPDGKKLFFGCKRQRPGEERAEYGNIWVAERTATGWGEPRYHNRGMYVSSTRAGDLYMTDVTNVAGGGLVRYPLVNGAYGAPEKLAGSVNEPTWAAHSFIAADESYIVFDTYSRPGAQGGEGDLFAVFRNPDGSWSDAFNLGDAINTPGTNFCPMVSPDGKYLFYSAGRDIYWVSAEVIHRLRPDAAPQAFLSEEIKNIVLAGDLPRLQTLLAKDPELLKTRDTQGRTALHLAAAAGHLEMARWIIGHGAEIDARTVQMSTPLMHASLSAKTEMVRLLIDHGADREARDSYGRTALILVARDRGDAEMARILLAAGADINAADRWNDTALSLAAWRGFSNLVDLLLDRGARIPSEPDRKQQGFVMAISRGLERLFDRLLPGADLAGTDALGGGLLHVAADGGSEHILGKLLGQKFDVNRKDNNGWTPLHRAAERGQLRAASLLIEHGARLNERTLAGETPFNLAQTEKNTPVADLLAAKGADSSAADFPVLLGEYLGQKKPSAKPELFAPGIVSGRFGLHSTAAFSPDGREVYWSLMIAPRASGYSIDRLLVSRLRDGRWTCPQIAPFSSEGQDADVPFFTPDGKRLYFMSRRPLPGSDKTSGEHIWFLVRQGDGWSEARPVDDTVNRLPQHWQFSVDRDYNLYFSTTVSGGQGRNDIYCAKYENGRYSEPLNLGGPVNTAGGEEMPFIASDGSYLLFMREFDLMVSFRGKDGSWSEPVNLGTEINSPEMDLCPMVSADGRYLFFLSQRGGESHTWWVEAKFIKALKPTGLN